MVGDNIAKINFDIDDKLFEDLKNHASKTDSNYLELAKKFIQQGLNNQKGFDNMLLVGLNDNVVEKVKIVSKLTDKTPDEVVNDTLWDNLRKIEDISDDVDGERILSMLDHDKPEGDDILDRLLDLSD